MVLIVKAVVLYLCHILGKFGRRQSGGIFSYLSQKIDFDLSCTLSPLDTISMKCQRLFSGKNKNTISKM